MNFSLEKLHPDSILSDRFIKPDRISQNLWYLNIVSPDNYILQKEEYYLMVSCQSWWTIDQIIIPPFIQRMDPVFIIPKRISDFNPKDVITGFPCGLLSLTNRIQNVSDQLTEQIRTNYILKLDKPYSELFKNYNNGHKSNLKHVSRQNLQISESNNIDEFIDHYLNHSHADIPRSYKNREMISNLVFECMKKDFGKIYKVENNKKEILGCSFVTIYNKRIVYLLSCSSPEGKKQYVMHAIIDEIIKSYSASDYVLDFEGSMIPGIAYFMKGFGAEEENYFVYEWNEHWLCRLKRRIKNILKGSFYF